MEQSKQYIRMTETPIPKLVIQLGIPTTISMLVTSVYNMADTYFIGKYGTSASGAVGVVFGLMSIIQALGFMFGQGAGSLCSRALGARKNDRASLYSSTGFFASLVSGALITLIGFLFMNPLMHFLGSTDTILPYAKEYARFILLAAPFMCASCVLNNVLRYEGRAAFAMIGLGFGGILNIFGDWFLMSYFKLGMTGAGISTAVSQTVSFFILLSVFFTGKTSCRIALKNLSRNIRDVIEICKVGFPALIRQGLASLSTVVLNNQVKVFGDAAVAAMSIVNRICFFTFATALGIGQGFQPVCAFNFGAKKYQRVRKAFLFTFIVGEVLLGSVALIGIFFTTPLVHLFRNDPEVVRIGSLALGVQFVGQIFQPLAVCSNMMFQSVGHAKTATLLSMLRNGLFFLPLLYILSAAFGLTGVQITQGISDVLTMFAAMPFALKFLGQMKGWEKAEANEPIPE